MKLCAVGAGLAPALLLAFLCTGCVPHQAALPKPAASDTDTQITLSTQPATLRQMDPVQMTVQVTNKNNQPVTGAQVTVQLAMPAMDMGRNEVALHAGTTPGTYVGMGRFTMPGDWQASVQIKRQGQYAEKTVPLTVQ